MSRESLIYVLIPGITRQMWQSGGLLIAQKAAVLLAQYMSVTLVTYRDHEKGVPFLDDILAQDDPQAIYLVTWGPHVNELMKRLKGRNIVYYSQSVSTRWRISLPASVPILCLSRYIMASWALRSPHNPLFLLPPVLEPSCRTYGLERDIDVLFLARKSSPYLVNHLVPALQDRCRVQIITDFISREDLFRWFNRSRVYLYSTVYRELRFAEGFGLQPLEAMVCGCIVFSNLFGGLSDFIDPEINAFQLEIYSLQYDKERILQFINGGVTVPQEQLDSLAQYYSQESFCRRIPPILHALEEHFQQTKNMPSDLRHFATNTNAERWRARLRRAYQKLMPV